MGQSTNPIAMEMLHLGRDVYDFRIGFATNDQFAMAGFAAWFSLQGKPTLSAQEMKDILNPGTTSRAKMIGYNDRWNKNKDANISAFKEACECECG
jgi:hypothetical protein